MAQVLFLDRPDSQRLESKVSAGLRKIGFVWDYASIGLRKQCTCVDKAKVFLDCALKIEFVDFVHSAIGLNTQEYDKWDQEYDKEDREPWSSGLWEETVFKRSWVHLRDVFRIDLLQVKRFVYWKRPKIIEKEDGQVFFI